MNPPGLFDTDAPEIPVPPLRLRRIRLHGVGPSGARFDPLDLDFTASGEAASRVLLSLTNTGGKSTLITLVSSVIVPAAPQQVGGKNLGDYLLTGDTGHVVCEWEDSSTGTRTVTGVVMEWKDGKRQPSEKQRSLSLMNRTWYLFQTGPDRPGFDDLPFLTGTRRSSREQFLASLGELFSEHPTMRGISETKQHLWRDALDTNTSIDPVLFTYQMRMNDSESGAEALLATFNSPENVVRFFVGALNDDQATLDFTTRLAEYAKLAERRPQLEALHGFCTEAGPAVADVAHKAEADTKAQAAERRAAVEGEEFAAALRARILNDTAMLDELREAAEAAAARATQLRRETGAIPDIRSQLRLEQARDVRATREIELLNAQAASQSAEDEAAAWSAVDDYLTAVDARAELRAAQSAFDRADEGLAPLRSDVQAAGRNLAARLDSLIEAATAAEQDARADATGAEAEFEAAGKDAKRAEEQRGVADRAITAGRNATAAATAASDEARQRRLLAAGESPADAAARWNTTRDEAREEAKAAKAGDAAAEAAFDAEAPAQRAAESSTAAANQALTKATERAGAFSKDLAKVADNEAIKTLLDGPAQSPDDLARAGVMAGHAASAADLRANGHEARAAAAERDLDHLQENGTARPSIDVLAVQQTLDDARIGAVTGLMWADRNIADPELREHFIRNQPEVAGGVVVTDPSRFDEAVAILTDADLTLRSPVTATTAPGVAGAPPSAVPNRHVVLPHRATWDRAWAEATKAELAETARSEGEAGRQARDSAASHRSGAAAAEDFTSRWHDTDLGQLEGEVRAAETRRDEATAALKDIEARRQQNREAAATYRKAAERADKREREAHNALGPLGNLVELTDKADRAREQRPRLEQDRRDALEAIDTAERTQKAARLRATDATTRAETHRGQKRQMVDERSALTYTPAETDPGGNLVSVRARLATAERLLGDAAVGMEESRLLEHAKGRHETAAARLNDHGPGALARAEVLAGTIDAANLDVRHRSTRRARDLAAAAQHDYAAAGAALETSKLRVKENSPSDPSRPNHADLATTPQWKPGSPGEIGDLLVKLEDYSTALRDQTNEATRSEEDARELYDAVSDDIRGMDDSATMWRQTDIEVASMPPFKGQKEAARTEVRRLIAEHQEANARAATAAAALAEALAQARRIASDTKWVAVEGSLPVRIRGFADHEFTAEAPALHTQIAALAASARGDLDAMDTHRTLLRNGLIELCSEQRSLLKEVSSSSRLPEGLGGLTNQLAIKIGFETAAEDEAAGRLAERIDQWALDIAANPKRAASADMRVRWIADAVGATVIDRPRAGRFSIEVLKPTLDGQLQYCAPDRIPVEFSGGQVLTLAVLVYCSLSKVRSSRRVSGARPAGTLLLDNPFGAASAPQLIAMQHRLAARSGVQLICATGIHDPGVDAAFSGKGSVVVKLRNDGDVRRNMSFLRLRSSVVEGFDVAGALTGGRDPEDPTNWVDATSYRVQP